ncbi:hypothetical protein ACP4OV_029603 [Aristida adscensionis]
MGGDAEVESSPAGARGRVLPGRPANLPIRVRGPDASSAHPPFPVNYGLKFTERPTRRPNLNRDRDRDRDGIGFASPAFSLRSAPAPLAGAEERWRRSRSASPPAPLPFVFRSPPPISPSACAPASARRRRPRSALSSCLAAATTSSSTLARREMDRVKHRFSTHRFRKVVNSLSPDQRLFVVQNGWGNLLQVADFTVPIPFLEWLMDHIIVGVGEFRHRNKLFKLSRLMVSEILGIPSGQVPVNLQHVSEDIEAQVNVVKSSYIINQKATISEAIRQTLQDHNEDSFLCSFMLMAISIVICPPTQNFVNLKYLGCLMNPLEIRNFDWAGHAIEYLLSELKRYQGRTDTIENEYVDNSYYYGSCLPILAIAYMDFLDLETDFGAETGISYSVPRICHVKTEDFKYVMDIDRNRRNNNVLHTPHNPPDAHVDVAQDAPLDPTVEDHGAPPPDPTQDQVLHLHPSDPAVQDHGNHVPSDVDELNIASLHLNDDDPEFISFVQLHPTIETIVKKHFNLLVKESLEVNTSASFRSHVLPIFANRLSLVSSEVFCHGAKISNIDKHNTSEEVGFSQPNPSAPDDDRIHLCHPEATVQSPVNFENVIQTAPSTPACHATSDINIGINLAMSHIGVGDVDMVSADNSPVHTHDSTAFEHKDDTVKVETTSATINKRKRKRRAAKDFDDNHGLLSLKVSAKVEDAYIKYIRTELLRRKDYPNNHTPTFVAINGFHCCYERLRDSLRPRGLLFDDVMALYVQLFNEERKSISDSSLITSNIVSEFNPESIEAELTRINSTNKIAKADLLLFPICINDHWVLIVINYLHKKINFFDSMGALSTKTRDLAINSVVSNFQKACKVSQICDRDFMSYERIFPPCPRQSNTHDCSLFVMLFMEYFDGKKIKMFEKDISLKYRKIIAHKLIASPLNEIDVTKFKLRE